MGKGVLVMMICGVVFLFFPKQMTWPNCSKEQFQQACQELAPILRKNHHVDARVKTDPIVGDKWLRISRYQVSLHVVGNYDIIQSPSYQVPMIYASFYDDDNQIIADPNQVISILQELWWWKNCNNNNNQQAIVSQGEHPITGFASFYAHPCLTGQSMQTVWQDGDPLNDCEYLLSWLTTYGPPMGLSIPSKSVD